MLSITVCTLNEQDYLPKLLDSIIDQNFNDIEVIIVDAESIDNTKAVAQKYMERSSFPIKFIEVNGIKNISIQRNIGAKNARHNNLLFLDADVVLPKNFISKALYEIQINNIEIAGCKIYATERNLYYRFLYWIYSNGFLPILRLFRPAIHGCCIFSTKNLHNKIGGFDENLIFEDYKYGADAAKYYRAKLLKSAFAKTSARRFYNANFKEIFELFFAGFVSLFRSGIKKKYMKNYFKVAGNHSKPKY